MQLRASPLLGTACVALAAIGWGTWSLFVRGRGLPAAWESVMILLVIGIASLPGGLTAASRAPRRPPRGWLRMGALGLVDAGNYVCYFAAIERAVGIGVLTHYLAPVLVAALAPIYLREPLGKRTPFALAGGIAGLVLLLAGSDGLGGAAVPAAALGTASAFFYAANTLISKKLFAQFSPAEVLSFHSFVAAAVLAVLARDPLPPLRMFLFAPLAGALLAGTLCGWLYYVGLRRIPAQRAAVLTYLEPLVASVVGAVAFGERLGAPGLLGAALILAGGAAVALQPET